MASDRVECRSDHDYIGRPIAFFWQNKRLEVAEVLIQNRTPTGFYFQVLNNEFGRFDLEYDTNADKWAVHQL